MLSCLNTRYAFFRSLFFFRSRKAGAQDCRGNLAVCFSSPSSPGVAFRKATGNRHSYSCNSLVTLLRGIFSMYPLNLFTRWFVSRSPLSECSLGHMTCLDGDETRACLIDACCSFFLLPQTPFGCIAQITKPNAREIRQAAGLRDTLRTAEDQDN